MAVDLLEPLPPAAVADYFHTPPNSPKSFSIWLEVTGRGRPHASTHTDHPMPRMLLLPEARNSTTPEILARILIDVYGDQRGLRLAVDKGEYIQTSDGAWFHYTEGDGYSELPFYTQVDEPITYDLILEAEALFGVEPIYPFGEWRLVPPRALGRREPTKPPEEMHVDY